MNGVYLTVTIVDRGKGERCAKIFEDNGIAMVLSILGYGTATDETLDLLGLESTEKTVLISSATYAVTKRILKELVQKMMIDIPGNGIAFTIRVSSVGGQSALNYLTGGEEYVKSKEDTSMSDTPYELIVAIANHGYTDLVMNAARKANARGGTIINARGSGRNQLKKFFGVSIANERELGWIITKKEDKNAIMQSIMLDAGMETKAQSWVFSLPVDSVVGLRHFDIDGESVID